MVLTSVAHAARLGCLAAGALIVGAPLAAQTEIPAQEGQPWRSPVSEFVAPPVIEGHARTDVTRFDEDGYNVAANYNAADGAGRISVYVYRAGVPDLPIWADRAATGMLSNARLDYDLDRTVIRTFTPGNGAGVDSGWLLTVPVGVPEYTSSGLAIFGYDGWLVKLRITSTTLDANQLADQMERVAQGLQVARATTAGAPFATIEDCADPLKFGKEAKLVRLDMVGSILLGAVLSAAQEKKEEQSSAAREPAVWCRHPSSTAQYGIYQSDRIDKGYLVALGDSGTSATVQEIRADELLKPSRMFIVRVSDGVTDEVAQPFARMPTPGQTVGAALRAPRVFSADVRPGGDGERVISVPGGE